MLGKTLVYVFPTTIYSHIRTFSLSLCISLCDSFDVGIPMQEIYDLKHSVTTLFFHSFSLRGWMLLINAAIALIYSWIRRKKHVEIIPQYELIYEFC